MALNLRVWYFDNDALTDFGNKTDHFIRTIAIQVEFRDSNEHLAEVITVLDAFRSLMNLELKLSELFKFVARKIHGCLGELKIKLGLTEGLYFVALLLL